MQSLRLKNILTRQVVRLTKKDEDSRPRLLKTTLGSSHMAAVTLELFHANRRRLPVGIHVHLDRPHYDMIEHKDKLELTISLVDCQDHEKNVKIIGSTNLEVPIYVGCFSIHVRFIQTNRTGEV